MLALLPWFGLFDIFLIQGMKARGKDCSLRSPRRCTGMSDLLEMHRGLSEEIPVTRQIGRIKKRIYDAKQPKE